MINFKRLPLKTGVLYIVIGQAFITCLIVIILIQVLSNGYTNVVLSESTEILNLYTERVESHLSDIEKLSYDILSNREMQSNMLKYEMSQSKYDKHTASTDLYTQLLTRTISEKYVVSVNYIFNDGNNINVGIKTVRRQSGDYLAKVYEKAMAAKGSNIWTINPDDSSIISSVRLIRDSSGTNGFIPLGVLVINLDAKQLLSYSSLSSQKYGSNIISYADGNLLSYNDSQLSERDISLALNQNKSWGKINLSGTKYFYVVKNSGETNWKFINILKSDNILSDISSMQNWYLFLFLLLVLFLMFLAAKFADVICLRVVKLSHSMMRVKDGVFEKQPEYAEGKFQIEEIVQLTDSYNTMITKIDYLINEVYKKQFMISDMRYKILQHQVNPHFLYNTLETIHWKAVESDNNDISTMVMSISNLLRTSVSKEDVITVEEDLKLVVDYIAVQQIRFEERLEFSMEPDPFLFSCKIPKMTIQPIVENSIRHNLEKFSGVCKIMVSFKKHENFFSILVHDNGKAVDIDKINRVFNGLEKPAGTGLGLKNIHERIQICFGNEYGIKIYSEPGSGICVEIQLPYEKNHAKEEGSK